MATSQWWSSESFWRKTAIWVTGGSMVILILLTMDTLPKISAGSARVPAYSVINQRIEYKMDETRHVQVPVIGQEEPLFGAKLSEEEAEALVSHGKMTVQAKNCMNCHTLLGNGAYYAPDLTKAWLDQYWAFWVRLAHGDSPRLARAFRKREGTRGEKNSVALDPAETTEFISMIELDFRPGEFLPAPDSGTIQEFFSCVK